MTTERRCKSQGHPRPWSPATSEVGWKGVAAGAKQPRGPSGAAGLGAPGAAVKELTQRRLPSRGLPAEAGSFLPGDVL